MIQTDEYPKKGRFMMMGGFGGFGLIVMLLGAVLSIAVLIGLVLLIVWAVRRVSGDNSWSGPQILSGQSAKEIARARYAKGEITREEYQQILSDLDN